MSKSVDAAANVGKEQNNARKAKKLRIASIISYLGVLASIAFFISIDSTDSMGVRGLLLVITLLPLALAFPGMLEGRRYTYKWCSLVSLLYFGGALTSATSSDNYLPGLIVTLLTLVWFVCVAFYCRVTRPE